MNANFFSNSVKELQIYLRNRGVVIANQRKLELVRLCEAAEELGIEVDPDGLHEDREEVLHEKLKTHDDKMLTNPAIEERCDDISFLPQITIFDLYNYLLGFKSYDHGTLKNYQRMEGYSMFEDGHVLDLKTTRCKSEGQVHDNYFAIISQVKPRTNEKDPFTKRPHYTCWIVVTDEESHQRGSIYSAYCCCKGGIDGGCRHVVATLFELMDFANDAQKRSVTSGPCRWVKRARENEDPILATDLDTSYVRDTTADTPRPTQDRYNPIEPDISLPDKAEFYYIVKETCPAACILDNIEVRRKQKPKDNAKPLDIPTPMEKIEYFFETHECLDCNTSCVQSLKDLLEYNNNDFSKFEVGTRGQNDNENWHLMRKGILTASKFKDIIHCRDNKNMAEKLLMPPSLDENRLPAPILFGRNYESKARTMYIKSHRYRHRKCSYNVPGLLISKTNAFLGASPDGIVNCSICGTFLIEVKCLFAHKNFHPKNALIVSKICEKDDDGNLSLVQNHKYYYQIQGQLAISGLQKCVLIAYTQKGIYTVDVDFDVNFWKKCDLNLSKFYNDYFYFALKDKMII